LTKQAPSAIIKTLQKKGIDKMLIIHETDCHGCGNVYYNGYENHYSYDDEMGDIRRAVDFLIEIGFIDPDTVAIYDGQSSIYEELDRYFSLEKELDKS
jgi:hypothetical protein